MDDIRWVSSTRAAEVLGITARTLYRLIDEGQLRAYRLGRVIRLREFDVEAFIAAAQIVPGTMGHLVTGDELGAEDAEFLAFYDAAANGAGDGVHVDGA